MKQKEIESVSNLLVQLLRNKSKRGLEYAKKIMLEEKIESEVIREALNYYVSNWEILTHPAPFSIAYESVGGDVDKMVEAQAAVTMLSAALDLHDDIIDRSNMKRRKQTVFGKYGSDMALLLGNAFFVEGFVLLGRFASRLIRDKPLEAFEIVRKGLFEVGDAHALEFGFKRKMHADPDQYLKILKMKAATTEMCMQLGGLLGGGTVEEVEALTRYGRMLGTLAALREEFIDIYEKEELTQRRRNECLPIPILFALRDKNAKEIERILAKRRMGERDISELLEITLKSRSVERLKKEMMVMIEAARDVLCNIRNEESKNLLAQLVASMVEDL